MTQNVIQHSFSTGELAPQLYARVDLQKYHSAAAFVRNFFVDFRGGLSTRPGTKYVLECYKPFTPVRLIPFKGSLANNYVLEFGDHYIRFFNNAAPILETSINITGVTTGGNTITATNTYNANDWVFVTGVGGITNINQRYFIVTGSTGSAFTVDDLFGAPLVFTGTYTSGGTSQRVYTLQTPYAASDLATLKFTQNVNYMVLTHPSYPPNLLTINAPNNWSLNTIGFGATVGSPTISSLTTTLGALASGWQYAYTVTAVDASGQESPPATPVSIINLKALNDATNPGTNILAWGTVSGAVSYNVYKASPSFNATLTIGMPLGFIGNTSTTTFFDATPGIQADFTQTPPVAENPFIFGAGVLSYTIGTTGTYTAVPSVTVGAPPAGGVQAVAQASLGVTAATINSHGGVYDITTTTSVNPAPCIISFPNGETINVLTVTGGGLNWTVATYSLNSPGSITGVGTPTPTNPVVPTACSAPNFFAFGGTFNWNLTWGVTQLVSSARGAGYLTPPSVSFTPGGASATSVLGPSSGGNPSCVTFFQQRLVMAAPSSNPQQFNMSQTGAYQNFNISSPVVQADDAVSGQLVSTELNSIKSMLPMSTGLVLFTDKSAWLLNGGSLGSAVTPSSLVTNQHSYKGASDVPPIVINFDVLYVQAKGSVVRDLTYNYYAQIYTGADITLLSSHLFNNLFVKEWAFAEEPYKVVWAVRNDGILLSLTYLKEQEIQGWAHHDTSGAFMSVTSVAELVSNDVIDATYFVVQRTINGITTQYIERLAERNNFQGELANAWCVDSGLSYAGSPVSSVSGLWHLIGQSVTGIAAQQPGGPGTPIQYTVISPVVVPANATISVPSGTQIAIVGLAFLPQMSTLPLDVGNPTVEGKRKQIASVSILVAETLGLSIGKAAFNVIAPYSNALPMKELTIGNMNYSLNGVVTDLVSGYARTIIQPSWDVPGQYFFQQNNPMPATILGVIPEIVIGDTEPQR